MTLQEKLDHYAFQQRSEFRKHKKGLPSSWRTEDEELWRRDPEDWAWLDAPERLILTLPQLKRAVKEAGISTPAQYRKEYKNHPTWPAGPDRLYKDWKNWPSLFGRKKVRYLSFPQLKKSVRLAGVESHTEYIKRAMTNSEWPYQPRIQYPDDWVSMNDLLGTAVRVFITFPQLRRAVRKANITSGEVYARVQRKHKGWPSKPNDYYKNWVSWDDFFDREKVNFLTLPELKVAVRKANVGTGLDYRKSGQKNWPAAPEQIYDDWVSWFDLFGRQRIGIGSGSGGPRFTGGYLSLPQLKKEVRKKGINSKAQYMKARKNQPNWHSNPGVFYGEKWVSWGELFGKPEKEYPTLSRLKKEVRKEGIKTKEQYEKERKSHPNWPSNPRVFYKELWVSHADLWGA